MPEGLIPIRFGGLASRDDDNLITIDEGYIVKDCILDTKAIQGRPAYRDVGVTLGAGGDNVQGIWRFRPSLASVRTVAVVGGKVYVITDPTSDTASDASASLLGTPFANGDLISGVQLGTNFYLGSNAAVAMQRIKWTSPDTYTLESLQAIPQGAQPAAALGGQVTWTVFSGITPTQTGLVIQTSGNTGFTNMASTWRGFSLTNNGNNDPLVGASAEYKLAADKDASANDWLAIAVSPHDEGYSPSVGPKRTISISVALNVVGTPDVPGTYQNLGAIYDVPPIAGAPNLIYCDLRTLSAATRAAIRWVQFKVTGTSGGKFIVYGYMFLPGKPVDPPPFNYYVDFYDPTSGQASALTEKLIVNLVNPSIQSYPDSYVANDSPKNDGVNDTPFTTTDREFNFQAGKARPIIQEIGNVVTITGTAPTFTAPASLTARLWKDTREGRRLVTSQTGVTSGGAYTLIDNGGIAVLSAQLYRPGGVLAIGLNALGAKGGRLIAGGVANKGHRQYISSFTPTSDTTNPFPQWPDIAIEDADGWSFDLAPAPNEQIVAIDGEGDAVYTGTNLGVHSMGDLSPGTLPYLVFRRGLVSRRGMAFLEEFIAWAATDGIYFASNRSRGEELSGRIKRFYKETFLPSNVLCMGYDIESRSLIIIQGTQMLRYCFAADQGREWSGPHTLADTVRHIASWIDPPGASRVTPQFWMLTTSRKIGRLQASATRDMEVGTDATTGTKIPDWQFSTGFDKTPMPAVIKGLSIDSDGVVNVRVAKTTASDMNAATMRQTSAVPKAGQDEVFVEGFGDFRAEKFRFEFSAANDVTLKRAEFKREAIDAVGG